MVDSEEVDELLVVLDILLRDLDGGLEREDVVLLARLALEERLEGRLALGQLLELLLVAALLALGRRLQPDHVLATLERALEALQVEQLALQPVVGLLEGVAHPLPLSRELLAELLPSHRVRQYSLAGVCFSHVLEVVIFVLNKALDGRDVGGVLHISDRRHLLELLLLDLHDGERLSEEALEVEDVLLVLGQVGHVLGLVDVKVLAVLLENL